MLNEIKAMLKEKQQFLEAAQMIVEDAMDLDLDDSIVLGESVEPVDDESAEETAEEPVENEESPKEEVPPVNNVGDILDEPVEPEVSEDPEEPTPTLDELPTPVGKQTGLPITGDIEDVLDSTVDLKSNTIKDVLPIPPANAAEALPGDDNEVISQKVDSGFEGSSEEPVIEPVENPVSDVTEPEEPVQEPVEEQPGAPVVSDNEGSNLFKEAINIEGEKSSEEPPAEPTTEESVSTDDTTAEAPVAEEPAPDVAPEAEENPVTSAVIDKVNEANTEETPVQTTDMTKEEVLKKLSSLTKNIEDAKKLVIDSLNK